MFKRDWHKRESSKIPNQRKKGSLIHKYFRNREPTNKQFTFGRKRGAHCLPLAAVRHRHSHRLRRVLGEAAGPPGEQAGRPQLPVGREVEDARPEQHGAGARHPQPHPRRRPPRLLGLPAAAHLIRGTTTPRSAEAPPSPSNSPSLLGQLNMEVLVISRDQS